MTDYSELKRLAEAQPVKEWTHHDRGMSMYAKERMWGLKGPYCVSDHEDWGFTRFAASYIAAADPSTVLALIAENEALRKALTYIRDTTDDWHIVEKAADALIDSARKEG